MPSRQLRPEFRHASQSDSRPRDRDRAIDAGRFAGGIVLTEPAAVHGARTFAPLRGAALGVAGVTLHADCLGALYWAEQGLLIVADLHLEKGSSFAQRGQLLPPYDTTETLARLARLIAHYAPRAVIALGDNFQDGGGPARLSASDRTALIALQRGRDWIWTAGNHD